MNEVKKPVRGRVIAVVVAVCLLVGSAFALTPSIQEVMMPDPYGIMPLMLDDENLSRSVYFSDTITLEQGYLYFDPDVVTFGPDTLNLTNVDPSNGYNFMEIWLELPSQVPYVSYNIPASMYIDYCVDVDYSLLDYSHLVVSGGFGLWLEWEYPVSSSSSNSVMIMPDSLQLLFNGYPVGSVFDGTEEVNTFADQSIELTDDVTSIGVRATYSSRNYYECNPYSGGAEDYAFMNLWWNDELSVIPSTTGGGNSGDSGSGGDSGDSGDSGEDSGSSSGSTVSAGQVERVIAWQQNTYTAVNDINSALNPNNSGSVGSYIKESAEDTSNIASVYASESDIQLKSDMEETTSAVVSSFYDQTSDSSSSMTVETVQNVKGVADGVDALMSSGYSVSSAFTEIAENDDFMSWFTSECASALDATGAVATVGDDDPYNMHYYYDHIAELEERRGD